MKDEKHEESPSLLSGRRLELVQDETYEESPSLLSGKRLETKENKVKNFVSEKKSNNFGIAEKLLEEDEEEEEEIVRKTERNKKRFSSSNDWPNEYDFELPPEKQSKNANKNSSSYPERSKSPSILSNKRSRERESNKNKGNFQKNSTMYFLDQICNVKIPFGNIHVIGKRSVKLEFAENLQIL